MLDRPFALFGCVILTGPERRSTGGEGEARKDYRSSGNTGARSHWLGV